MLQQPPELLNDKERPLLRRSFPICPKCNQTCSKEDGSFVRAFNQVYHVECFVCEDCLVPVADKYYTIEDQPNHSKKRKVVLCEYHHSKRLGFICIKCNKPTTTEHQPHPECIQCPSCVTPTVHQYDFKGQSYCRLHYSLIPETRCAGCNQAILKQFVEHKDLPDQIWHPECYMIFKFWGVKLAPKQNTDATKLIKTQKEIDHQVTRVWTDLSSFEESSANCISDMLLNVAAGAYKEGIRMVNQFIMHLEVLFSALDLLQQHYVTSQNQDLDCNKEANLICKQMIRFFQLLTIPTKTGITITQELLSLVTGLAQNLKSLIRIGLKAALHLERDIGIQNVISQFLDLLLELEKKRVWIAGRYWFKDPPSTINQQELIQECTQCHLLIQDTACYQCQSLHIKWHPDCFKCSICSTLLNEKTAHLQQEALLCQSCCAKDDPSILSCTRVCSLEQSLIGLKLYLANTTASTKEDKKSPKEMMMPEAKRQRSILRLLGNRTLQNQSTVNKIDTSNSVHLGQIGHTYSTTTLKDTTKKKENNLVISTTALESPVSPFVSPVKGNRLTDSIRRTFSTSSQLSKKGSLHSVFDRHRNREARRTSILTMDDSGSTLPKCVHISTLTASQDFIVRHAAVIAIEPLITPPFSLNELVDLIDTKKKKSKTSTKRKSSSIDNHQSQNPASLLWGKLITHIKTPPNTLLPPPNLHHTFGISLTTVAGRDHAILLKSQNKSLRDVTPGLAASFSENALIPIFVKSCIMVILQSDMSIEGVFRKNGNIRQLQVLSDTIDQQEQTLESMESLLTEQNPIQLAAILKRYLRELPEPLFTYALYPLFLRCGRMQNNQKVLHLACCLLPKANRDTMLMLFCCLKWIATFSDTNKMDIPNLARVIAPSVLFEKPSPTSNTTAVAADLRQGAQEEINVIETLIRIADDISTIPTDLTVLTLNDIHQDMTGLNSKYFISHYQQLLNDLTRNQKSKSTNNSPLSTVAPKSSTLLLKHLIGIPKPSSFTSSLIPSTSTTAASVTSVPTPTKQRRTSWIPGLTRK